MRAAARLLSTSSVTLAICVTLAATAAAAPGELDPAFSHDGYAVTSFQDSYSVATDLALQPDGRLVVVGPVHGNGTIVSDLGIARYTEAGRLDRTFSTNGKRRVDLDGAYDQATAVAVQPDGGIVIVGTSGGVVAVVRLTPDGSLDDSFSGNGSRLLDAAAMATVTDVALQTDGRIVIAGSDGPDFALARLRPRGRLDATFGTRGSVHTDFAGYGDAATTVAIAPDGGIVAAGWATVVPEQRNDFALVRYLPGGAPDPAFGDGGLVTTDFAAWEDTITDIALESSGAIVAAGQASQEPGGADQSSDVALARYLVGGELDEDFGDAGTTTTDFGSYFDQAHGVALQTDGKIVLSSHRYEDGQRTASVARYETGGDLDGSFGEGGIADTGLPVSGDEVGGVVVDPDGAIVSVTAAQVPADIGTSFAFLVLRLHSTAGVTGT